MVSAVFRSRIGRPKETFSPAEARRMVYAFKVRMEQDGVFGAFDCPPLAQNNSRPHHLSDFPDDREIRTPYLVTADVGGSSTLRFRLLGRGGGGMAGDVGISPLGGRGL